MNILGPFSVLQNQVCYLFIYFFFATSVSVENVPRCVRKVIFGGYFLQLVKKMLQPCSGSFFEL